MRGVRADMPSIFRMSVISRIDRLRVVRDSRIRSRRGAAMGLSLPHS